MALPPKARRGSSAPATSRTADARRRPRDLRLEHLELRDMPSAWQNEALPRDVNADGRVSPSDAVLVVNHLNRSAAAALPVLVEGESPPAYVDVNGDGNATAIDALLVVNWLNAQSPYLLVGDSGTDQPPALTYQVEPTGLTLVSDASDRIIARWSPSNRALGSVVSIRAGSAPPEGSFGNVVSAGSGTFILANLKPNTRYWVRVSSIDPAGNLSRGILQTIVTRKAEATNTHQLDRALAAGIQHLGNIRDQDNFNLPFFYAYSLTRTQAQNFGDSFTGRDSPAHMKFERHFVANVTARSLYAVLSAAQALGVDPPADVVANYARILLAALHKPRDGNWANTSPENQLLVGLVSDPANYRSQQFDVTYLFNAGQGFRGMLALATLLPNANEVIPEYGRSARQIFETSVYNLRKYYVYDGEIGGNRVYNWERFRQQLGLRGGATIGNTLAEELTSDWSNLWRGWADPHMIWPLVKYYEATGHQGSLELALELADMAAGHRFPSDPALVPRSLLPHMFETMAEMNAYSRLALVTGNANLMARVRLRYEYLRSSGIISKTGWVPENLDAGRDIGEANNTAELIETAMNFAEWGWTEYYQDVERFTRGHLLPAQLLDTSFVVNDATNSIDGQRDIRNRIRGAFGFPAPYGHISTRYTYGRAGAYFADVSAGAVGTLAEVQRHVYQADGENHRVNLLFDFENERIQVASPYPGGDRLIVTTKSVGNLAVRIPQWADRGLIEQAMSEQGLASSWDGEYLKIERPTVGRAVTIPMPLPRVRQSEAINGRTIWIDWHGDSVVGMSRMRTPQPFFAAI